MVIPALIIFLFAAGSSFAALEIKWQKMSLEHVLQFSDHQDFRNSIFNDDVALVPKNTAEYLRKNYPDILGDKKGTLRAKDLQPAEFFINRIMEFYISRPNKSSDILEYDNGNTMYKGRFEVRIGYHRIWFLPSYEYADLWARNGTLIMNGEINCSTRSCAFKMHADNENIYKVVDNKLITMRRAESQ